jgi:hypothetical protein
MVGILPVREHDSLTNSDNAEIRSFREAPRRIIEFEDKFLVLHRTKLVCYLKKEHLEIGKMNDFDKMSKKRSQFQYALLDFDFRGSFYDMMIVDEEKPCVILYAEVKKPSEYLSNLLSYYVLIEDIKQLMSLSAEKNGVQLISENLKISKEVKKITAKNLIFNQFLIA